MNVYVREMVSALAQAGVPADVFVRRWDDDTPDIVDVEPGFRVVHIDAGPVDLAKEQLPDVVDAFADGVRDHIERLGDVDALHANYWLSGVAGHRLKHELDLPLVSTFHTLARVKAETGDPEPARRVRAEPDVIACSDAILASCVAEADQLVRLYGADPARVEIVAPGVDHAFFSPGDRAGARGALRHLDLGDGPVLLFVGRIQPLKAPDVLLRAAAHMIEDDPSLRSRLVVAVVGGPSGSGRERPEELQKLAATLGIADVVRFEPPCPQAELPDWYRAADVTVVPSHSESFGLVAVESQACGTPVVAAAVGGLCTAVRDGESGVLVPGHDPADYAAVLTRLAAQPRLRHHLAQAAARHAAGFGWSSTVDRLLEVYTRVMDQQVVRISA
jgi:D-inositol-3-phosphate glycosyltransferase